MVVVNFTHVSEVVPTSLITLERKVVNSYEKACEAGDHIEATRILNTEFRLDGVIDTRWGRNHGDEPAIIGLALVARKKSHRGLVHNEDFPSLNNKYWTVHNIEKTQRQKEISDTEGLVQWDKITNLDSSYKEAQLPRFSESPYNHEITLMVIRTRQGAYTYENKSFTSLSGNCIESIRTAARLLIDDAASRATQCNSRRDFDSEAEHHSTSFCIYVDGIRSEKDEQSVIGIHIQSQPAIKEHAEFTGIVALNTGSTYGKAAVVVLREDGTSVRCILESLKGCGCEVGDSVSVVGNTLPITGGLSGATIVKQDLEVKTADENSSFNPAYR